MQITKTKVKLQYIKNVLQETMRYGISVLHRLPYYSYNDFGYIIIPCSPLGSSISKSWEQYTYAC